MKVSLKSLLAAVVAFGAMAFSASAAQVTASSTVAQSGYNAAQSLPTYPLTGTPYDFTGQVNAFSNVTSIDSLTVTLSVNDGDTGVGDFDENNLTLALDGIDTGLKLNGFANNTILSLSLQQIAPALQAALVAALQDGKLIGTINDATPGNAPAGDIIGLPSRLDTTLDLVLSGPNLGLPTNGGGGNPVPLPAGLLLAPLGVGLAGFYSRRFRTQK
jgi:hypothetical protein